MRSRMQYFTLEFFQELAARLNADPRWEARARGTNIRIGLVVVDRGQAFLIQVAKGNVSAQQVKPEEPAEFKLEGTYDNWLRFVRGEGDLQTLVMTGRLRFKGSIARIMALQEQMTILGQVARDIQARP